MTDPIADMLTRIRNSSLVKKPEIVLPMSKIKYEIGKILERENWVEKCEIVKSDVEKNKSKSFLKMRIILKYKKSGRPAIIFLKRVSKPGLRVYAKKDKLPVVLNGFGLAIISTPRGLLTAREAKKQKLGGEIICEIY